MIAESVLGIAFSTEPKVVDAGTAGFRGGIDFMMDGGKSATFELATKLARGTRGGNRQNAAGAERVVGRVEPPPVLEKRTFRIGHRRGVGVNQQRVKPLDGQRPEIGVAVKDHPRVVEKRGVVEMLTQPAGQIGRRFGDVENRALLEQDGARAFEDEAEAETGDPDPRLAHRAKGRAGDGAEFGFRRAGRRSGGLGAVAGQVEAAVVLVEAQRGTVGQIGFGKGQSGFHSGCDRGLRGRAGFCRSPG